MSFPPSRKHGAIAGRIGTQALCRQSVFDTVTLQRLVTVFGEDRVLIGTDYPFNFREADPIARIEEAIDQPGLWEKLAFSNARTFLGLDEASK